MKTRFMKHLSVVNILFLLAAMVVPFLTFQKAEAVNLGQTMVRFDRLAASTATGGTVCAMPSVTNLALVEGKVIITFPADFVLSEIEANWTTNTTDTSWPSGAATWPTIQAIATLADNTAKTVTFTSGNLGSSSTLYCFNFSGTTTLTTGAAAASRTGTVETQTGASAAIDSSNYATAIVSGDQIQVTATVPPIFTFALEGTSDTFTTNLTTDNAVSTNGKYINVGTNAANGWIAWVKSANAGLDSATTTTSIDTIGTIDGVVSNLNPTTGYLLDAVSTTQGGGAGTMSISTEYDGDGAGGDTGGTLSVDFQTIASADGTTDGDKFTLYEKAFISATQGAATDYTDTLTIVGAGMF